MILSCRALRYGCSDTSKTKNVFTGDDPINSSGIFFISFFVTRETVALHVNDPIITDTSIWSFRELEHQNLS